MTRIPAKTANRSARVLFFGASEASHRYPRTQQVMARLGELGYEVHSALRTDAASSRQRVGAFRSLSGLALVAIDTVRGWSRSIAFALRTRPSHLWVAYPGLLDLLVALPVSRILGATVIYDAMICVTQTVVDDRALIPQGSWRHRLLRWVEATLLGRAALVVTDTPTNRDYLLKTFDLPPSKISVVPIAINEQSWWAHPLPPQSLPMRVAFWGTFVPLQGAPVIAEAINRIARECTDQVQFVIIGDGQDGDRFAAELDAHGRAITQWTRSLISEPELAETVRSAHLCLGIFGASDKAHSVVPYKLVQALATGRPVITMASPEADQLSPSGALTCVAANDSDALALAIRKWTANMTDLTATGAAARLIYDERYSITAQRRHLRSALDML